MMVLQASGKPLMEAAIPFVRYLTTNYNENGPWLTKGTWSHPPYGDNFALAKDKLQIPNEVTGVVEVRPKWYEPVRGPREIKPDANAMYGSGGGVEYYRDWKWSKNSGEQGGK